ncbi:VanZ family protein [Clostridium sp. PL3]|uniref:VanZ family protein n=1 Tax=Clostridium thailandense TaxID=2794346 RepID=A0A949TQT3_9CLOT|nr:VanZ family protein [Clostridium thailandense]MBV7271541.1 VanZ family protein [Clostridium thailandense]
MKKNICILLSIFWICFIFYNSSNDANISEARSHKLLNDIKTQCNKIVKQYKNIVQVSKTQDEKLTESKIFNQEGLIKLKNTDKEEILNKFLRKNAHAFEYLVLAILVSSILFSFNIRGKGALTYIMFICLLYAVLDEFYQSFIPGRTSLVSDVLIDFLGSILGMVVFYFLYYKLKIKSNGKRFSQKY